MLLRLKAYDYQIISIFFLQLQPATQRRTTSGHRYTGSLTKIIPSKRHTWSRNLQNSVAQLPQTAAAPTRRQSDRPSQGQSLAILLLTRPIQASDQRQQSPKLHISITVNPTSISNSTLDPTAPPPAPNCNHTRPTTSINHRLKPSQSTAERHKCNFTNQPAPPAINDIAGNTTITGRQRVGVSVSSKAYAMTALERAPSMTYSEEKNNTKGRGVK